MKHLIFCLLLISLLSCEKEEFSYNYPDLDKLLIAVTRTYIDSEYRTEFKYDSLNRLIETKTIFPEEQTTIETYVYNEKGKMIEKSNGDYITTYMYNSTGRLIEQNIHYESSKSGYQWNEKTAFKYKNGKINKGIRYSDSGEITSYISYKYDSRGNTLEKIVTVSGEESDLNLVEMKFRYDTNSNPIAGTGLNIFNGYSFSQAADIQQVNNPVYSSYINLIMSSLPPEFDISYEYDADGLPLKAVFNSSRYPEQQAIYVVYEYSPLKNNF